MTTPQAHTTHATGQTQQATESGQQGPHLEGGLGYGIGFEGFLKVLSSGWLVLLGCLLLGQGLAIEGEGPLLGLEQLQAALMRLPHLGCLLPFDVLIPKAQQGSERSRSITRANAPSWGRAVALTGM